MDARSTPSPQTRPALTDWLQQRLARDGDEPLYRQLQQLLREAVLSGELPAQTRLPSTRQMASELGIARNTVIEVYEQLTVEGCLVSRRGSGTVVADLSGERMVEATPAPARAASTPRLAERRFGGGAGIGAVADAQLGTSAGSHAVAGARTTLDMGAPSSGSTASALGALSPRGRELLAAGNVSARQWGAFMPGVPDVTEFPSALWARLQNRYWRRAAPESLSYAPAGGLPALREALAAHLRAARSVRCQPEQVIITTGSHQSIDLTLRLLASPGDRVWLEDPCYWGLRSTLASLGADIVPMPVDAEGMVWPRPHPRQERRVPQERQDSPGSPALRDAPPPRLVVVTPSHQYPLGMVMSLARRQALLAHAVRHDSWIIEDDYDSEFRYGSRPLPALQGLDDAGRVIYVGSFSKVLFPALRVGYLVAPPALAESFASGSAALYREGQLWQQAVLAEFIGQGHLGAHIRRMRGLYSERRQALLAAITRHFGETLPVQGDNAGLHLVLRLPDRANDVAVASEALAAGIAVRPLSQYHADPWHAPRGLLLGYACVKPEEIGPAFDTLAAVIRRLL